MIRSPLASRYGMSPLGRGVRRAAGGGWWDLDGALSSCVAAYAPKGAASYAASLLDLSGNSNNAVEVNAPGWGATTGWTFVSASTDALSTVSRTSSDFTMIVRFSNAVINNPWLAFGFGYPWTGWNMSPGYSNKLHFYSGNTVGIVGGAFSSGVIAMNNTAGFKNGTTATALNGTTNTGTIYIGWTGIAGAYFWTGYVQAAAFYTENLSEAQIGLLTTAMNAL